MRMLLGAIEVSAVCHRSVPVRGWVRRVVRRADQLRGAATGHLHLLDPVAVPPEPTGSDLGDALATLAAATQAAIGRLGPSGWAAGGWKRLGRILSGRILCSSVL